jgi:hypothetical protein
MNINLHIERLVLDGLDIGPGQADRVKAATEAELSRLLSEGGLASSFQVTSAVPNVRADPIQVSSDTKPASLGRRISRAVYGGIGK